MRPSQLLLQVASLLASLQTAACVSFDCKKVVDDGVIWDLSALRGPKSVHSIFREPPTIKNFTFNIDICLPLKHSSSVPKKEQCEQGTWICGVEYMDPESGNETNWEVVKTVPVVGEYTASHGRHLDSKPTRLKDSDSNAESKTEGVRVEFSGSRYPLNDKKGVEQKAFIEFICDPEKTGNEGFDETEGNEDGKVEKRDDEDEELPNPQDDGKSLKFLSYKQEKVKGSAYADVLRLEWRTKYACENARESLSKGGWGFFTWFIIVYGSSWMIIWWAFVLTV